MSNPNYDGHLVEREIDIYEHPQPSCELVYKYGYDSGIVIRTPSDAKAIIESLQRYLASIGEEYK